MRQARSVAAAAGLTVTPTAIEGPGSPPQRVFGPVPADVAEACYQANAAYHRKVKAFGEAEAIVTEARQREAQAHLLLTEPMRTATSTVDNLTSIGSSVVLSTIGETQNAADELYAKADDIEAGHAETNGRLHLHLRLPYPSPSAAS